MLLTGCGDFRGDRPASLTASTVEDCAYVDTDTNSCRSSSPLLLPTLFRLDDSETSVEDDVVAKEVDTTTLKYDTYQRSSSSCSSGPEASSLIPKELRLALVSHHHSLWAEYVYNAARVLADRIDDGRIFCRYMRCLELGEDETSI